MVYYSFVMPPNGMLTAILAGCALSSLAVWMVRSEKEALNSLAEAERAFSKRCGEVGFRQSFLDNFAPEGVYFGPNPKNCQENLSKLPEEPRPAFPPFEWAPATADVSAAGDLGYTTGPVRFWSKDGSKAVRWGYYFSVWRREGRGPWKVIVDLGIDIPDVNLGDPSKVEFAPAPEFRVGRATYPVAGGAAEDALRQAEMDFGRRAAEVPMAEAMVAEGTANVRVHRDGFLPAVNRRAIGVVLRGVGRTKVWQTLGAGVAKSGDFGYTYGRFESETDSGKPRTGYWARAWKREDGRWRVVADVANDG